MLSDPGFMEHLPHAWKDRISINPDTECWDWRGWWRVRVNGRNPTARHAVYEYLVGDVPPKHVLSMSCGNANCVNPAHALPVGFGPKRKRRALIPVLMPRYEDSNAWEEDPVDNPEWESWNWLSDMMSMAILIALIGIMIWAVWAGHV